MRGGAQPCASPQRVHYADGQGEHRAPQQNAGPSLNLGGAGVLQNDGTVQSGSAAIGATTIDGSVVQTATGKLIVRLAQNAGAADSFAVTGTGQLGGYIQPVILDPSRITEGTRLNAILVAGGGLALDGLAILAPQSAIEGFTLSTLGHSLVLNTAVNFSPAGLSAEERQVGDAIAAIQAAGGAPFFAALVPTLVAIPSVTGLDLAYLTISSATVSAVPQSTMAATDLAIGTVTDRLDAWRIGSASGPSSSGNTTNIGLSLYGVDLIGAGYVSAIAYGGGGNTSFSHNLDPLGIALTPSVSLSNGMLAGRLEAGYAFPLRHIPAHRDAIRRHPADAAVAGRRDGDPGCVRQHADL